MKKLLYIFLLIITAASFLTCQAKAENVTESQAQALETEKIEEGLPESAKEIVGDISVMENISASEFFQRLVTAAENAAGDVVKSAVKSTAAILIISVLCAVTSSVCTLPGEKSTDYVGMVGVLAVTAASAGNITSFIGMGRETMDELNTFSKLLLPTLTAASAASGAVTAAAAKYGATMLFIDILITASNRLVMPLIYAYIAVSAGGAAIGGNELKGVSSAIKKLLVMIMTVLMLGFTVYLTLTGVIADSADAVTAKVTKTVISSALPVVGGIISDAASTVVSGVGIVRNAVGIFGLFAVCAVCLIPFLKLAVHYIFYKIAASLSAVVADGRISQITDSISTAFGMIMGLVGANGIMLFFSIISLLKAANI